MFPPDQSLHAQLRTSTRALHDEIERVVGLPESACTPEAYRRILRRFWGFQAPLEAALARVDWRGFDFESRRRADLALADLQALGDSHSALNALPQEVFQTPASDPAAWGMLYVLEGSTLGGRVIARAVTAALGLEAKGATRFFDGRGAAGGALWRQFLTTLDERVATPQDRSAAQAGAEATFRRMIAWFA